MNNGIGEKIKTLRKQKNISQEALANGLGVSFQAVSKWENSISLPDVTMIPAIAFFFGVSTDELFSFNLYEAERQVTSICKEAFAFRASDPQRAEEILRAGLQRYPGNEVLLNNLLYTIDMETRAEEVIELCRALIASAKDDAVRYDACRILASCYHARGEQALVLPTLEQIPEIYFTKLELMAALGDGDARYLAALKQKYLSAESLIDMLLILARHARDNGDAAEEKLQLTIACDVIATFVGDSVDTRYFRGSVYETLQAQKREITARLSEMEL